MTDQPVRAGPDQGGAGEQATESRLEWPAALLVLLVLVLLALLFYHLTPGAFSGGAVEVIIRPR